MKMDPGNPSFRCGYVSFNLIFFVGGCILMGIGIDAIAEFYYYFRDIDCYTHNCIVDLHPFFVDSFGLDPNVLPPVPQVNKLYFLFGCVIFVGISVKFVPVIGFCAAYFGRKRIIPCFVCFTCIAVIMETALSIVSNVVTLDGLINNFMEARDKDRTVKPTCDPLQREFKCCREYGTFVVAISCNYCGTLWNKNMACTWNIAEYFEQRQNVAAWTVIVMLGLQSLLILRALFLQYRMGAKIKNHYHNLVSVSTNDWHSKLPK